jgi:hypothetical protein
VDYLIGSFITILLAMFAKKVIIKNNALTIKRVKIGYSQSQVFNVIRPFIPIARAAIPEKNTQSREYEKKMTIRVIMTEGQAYWIKDNAFYTADLNEDYSVNQESTRIVDTMNMDKVQLDKIIFIVDKLTEDSHNDNSNSGNTWF